MKKKQRKKELKLDLLLKESKNVKRLAEQNDVEFTAQIQQLQQIGTTGENFKKRKHRKIRSEYQSTELKKYIAIFIKNHLFPSEDVSLFVSTKCIKDIFDSENAEKTLNENVFCKELRNQIDNFGFPKNVTYTQYKKRMGYKGLVLR